MISGVYMEASFIVIMSKMDKKNKVLQERSFPVPLKYIDVVRRTNTTVDVLQKCQIDDFLDVDGDWRLSGQWAGFTQFTLLNNTPLRVYTWSRGREG